MNDCILITLDLDFSDICTCPPHQYPGIVVLRTNRQDKEHLIARLQSLMPKTKNIELYGFVIKIKIEYHFVTNLPEVISNEKIAEIYHQCCQIESFWKFLRMHLKPEYLINKSANDITIQLYNCLIVFNSIARCFRDMRNELLDRLCYL